MVNRFANFTLREGRDSNSFFFAEESAAYLVAEAAASSFFAVFRAEFGDLSAIEVEKTTTGAPSLALPVS